MSILLGMNEWLNEHAFVVKKGIRRILPNRWRTRFANHKFDQTIRDESYKVTFTRIHRNNWWGSKESISGCGSEFERTAVMRRELKEWLGRNNIKKIFDAPCGDYNWMKDVVQSENLEYIGGDIVEDLIAKNRQSARANETFIEFDVLVDPIPQCDVWLCRDLLFHFPNASVQSVLNRFLEADVKYLIATHFSDVARHDDIGFGEYRPVNLCREPFNWPEPRELIFDGDETDKHRYLGVWAKER